MTESYRIEEATLSDIPALVNIWKMIDQGTQCEASFGGYTKEKISRANELIRHNLQSPNAHLLIALPVGPAVKTIKPSMHSKPIVGTLSGHIYHKPAVKASCVGVLYSLWVEPDEREQGLAKALLAAMEKDLIDKGAQAFQVGWDVANTVAARWWTNQGYAPYEVIASKKVEDRR